MRQRQIPLQPDTLGFAKLFQGHTVVGTTDHGAQRAKQDVEQVVDLGAVEPGIVQAGTRRQHRGEL